MANSFFKICGFIICQFSISAIFGTGCSDGTNKQQSQPKSEIESTDTAGIKQESRYDQGFEAKTTIGHIKKSTPGMQQKPRSDHDMTINISKFQDKLSPESKKLLLMERPQAEKQLHVLFQTEQSPSKLELKEIEATGCLIQSIAKDVLTCKVTVGDLPKLAVLDYVMLVEVSKPLYSEDHKGIKSVDKPGGKND